MGRKKKDDHIDSVFDNESVTTHSRTWVGVLWLENMREDWRQQLDMLIQNPYVYCIHDKDIDSEGNPRKVHVHLMITWSNTTTYKNALKTFKSFSKSIDQPCCNTCYRVLNVRYMYNYLIHDTETARKELKWAYSKSERIEGLGFDIGLLEQISVIDKKNMLKDLSLTVIQLSIMNYVDFYYYVITNLDLSYLDVVYSYSGHFERLCKGNYLKWQCEKEKERDGT